MLFHIEDVGAGFFQTFKPMWFGLADFGEFVFWMASDHPFKKKGMKLFACSSFSLVAVM